MVIFKLKKPNPINTMIPRVDRISMEREPDVEDGETVEARKLYSDSAYIKRRFKRLVNAYAYSNSARASGVELGESTYEEVDCSKERCYAYKEQLLESHYYDWHFGHTTFYSFYMIKRRIPGRMNKLEIENFLTSAESISMRLILEFRYRPGMYITEYESTRGFYMIV